jgi:hypothetical protein
VNGSGNNVSDGDTSNSDVSSTSNTHGLSQSDKIAIGVGVPTGVVTVIGVVLTYLGIRAQKGMATRKRIGRISSPAIAAGWLLVVWAA